MIPVSEALSRILAAVAPTGPEIVPLPDAATRVLAVPIVARLTQPPGDVSAMDGYALRAADAVVGTPLRITGVSPAGHPFPGAVGPGEAVRIFTGGIVPPGADTILIQEDATADAAQVTPTEAPRPGRHIRRAGLDFKAGDELLPAGRLLTARDIGLAAAANHAWLTVHRRPRIAILATGDEIALPGDPVPTGGIVSSNAHSLAVLVRAAGGVPTILPIVADDSLAIAAAGAAAASADLVVTSGGASVGDHDLVRTALAPGGFALDFWKVAMRPGKPLIWGSLGGTPLLGLPGNPVSALVCAILFLRPAIRRLSGLPGAPTPTRTARLAAPLPANDRREDYLRASVVDSADGPLVTAFPTQDSSMMRILAMADALILRPPHAAASPIGTEVAIIELDSLGL